MLRRYLNNLFLELTMAEFTLYTAENAPEESKPLLADSVAAFGMLPNLSARLLSALPVSYFGKRDLMPLRPAIYRTQLICAQVVSILRLAQRKGCILSL